MAAFVRALVLTTSVTHARSARATPGHTFSLSDDAALMAGAVIASGRDAASAWYNPALLGRNRRTHIDVSATAYGIRRTRASAGVLELVGDRERAVEAVDRQFIVVPTAFAVATAVRRRLTLGFGFFTTRWNEPDIRADGNALNLPCEYAYVHQVRFLGVYRRHHAGPMIGWSPVRSLQLGVSVLGIYDKQEFISRIFVDTAAFEGPEATTWTEGADELTNTFGGQLALGLRGAIGSHVLAGAALRTPAIPIHQTVSGSRTLVVASIDDEGIPYNRAELQTEPPRRRPTRLAPWTVSTGLAVRAEHWTVEVDVEASTALRGRDAEIRERATLNARFGARVQISPRWALGAGVFTDHGSTMPSRASDVDVDAYGGTFGIQVSSPVSLARSERSRTLEFRTTVAARYSGGIGRFGRVTMRFGDDGASDFTLDTEETTRSTHHLASLYVGTGLSF
jgi:hypothetical protein